jgi:hypothetical protein
MNITIVKTTNLPPKDDMKRIIYFALLLSMPVAAVAHQYDSTREERDCHDRARDEWLDGNSNTRPDSNDYINYNRMMDQN